MTINTLFDRGQALTRAKSLLRTSRERELTATEIDEATTLAAEVKAYDATDAAKNALARAKRNDEIMASFGALPDGDSDRVSAHLSLKGLGDRIASGMKAYSGNVSPNLKGLVPAGETIVDVPLVNTDPIHGATHERAPRLIDVLQAVARSAPHYSFLKQSTIASPGGAGVVAAGAVKPTKKLGVERVDSRLRVVAVLSEPIDKYLLEDASSLNTWVGSELADAIQIELENQILTGSGSGENFQGLATLTGVQTQAFQADPLVTLRYGLSDLETLGINPAFVALAPADWLAVQTTRNANGGFDVGGPIDATARTAWGTQVVVVPGLAAGTGWVVGEDSLVVSTDGRGVRVEWGTPGDTFTRNQLVGRVEGRFNLDVMRPHGLVKLDLTA